VRPSSSEIEGLQTKKGITDWPARVRHRLARDQQENLHQELSAPMSAEASVQKSPSDPLRIDFVRKYLHQRLQTHRYRYFRANTSTDISAEISALVSAVVAVQIFPCHHHTAI